ncbi:MAG: hypothetical protein QOH71_480 [Blastocatellia bacterium]|jgi:hypothetical protein|nr:hypothetical protein [Blastocatellia bacterium]
MNDESTKTDECNPPSSTAEQPHAPGSVETCQDPPPGVKGPDWKPPILCPPDICCDCKPDPTTDPNCLESLITDKAGELAEAEKTKAFKADLESLLTKANAASQEYTQAKYEQLLKEWVKQDDDIDKLIRNFVCSLPCWYCAIECYICPLLHKMNQAQQSLYWSSTPFPEKADNLYDYLYWHTRNKEEKETTFKRIKNVLSVWEKPAQTIEKALADNAKLISDIDKAPGTDTSKLVFDIFLRLVPRHLSIAPSGPNPYTRWKTKIDGKFTTLCKCEKCEDKPETPEQQPEHRCPEKPEKPHAKHCKCDTGERDNCCGPNVGYWTLRERLIGPQPYLIDPSHYIGLICCLVRRRYEPARKALSTATAKAMEAEAWIKQAQDSIENGLKDFEKNAKARLPTTIECCGTKICPEREPTKTAS